MVARLTLTMGPRTVVALLRADLKWRCEDLLTQTYLNACFSTACVPDGDTAPPGFRQAMLAAKAVEQAGWDVHLHVPQLNQSAA